MNWVHLHLALNHVPVLGTPFLLGWLLWSLLRGQAVTLRFTLWMFVVLAVAAIAIKFTGDFAAETPGATVGLDAAIVERHEQAADQATTGVFLMGVAAAFALVRARGGRPVRRLDVGLVAILAFGTFLMMLRTANLGGQLRHPAVRPSAEAAVTSPTASGPSASVPSSGATQPAASPVATPR